MTRESGWKRLGAAVAGVGLLLGSPAMAQADCDSAKGVESEECGGNARASSEDLLPLQEQEVSDEAALGQADGGERMDSSGPALSPDPPETRSSTVPPDENDDTTDDTTDD